MWQLPLLLLGVGLFVLGIWLMIPEAEPFDHQAELDEAQKAGRTPADLLAEFAKIKGAVVDDKTMLS